MKLTKFESPLWNGDVPVPHDTNLVETHYFQPDTEAYKDVATPLLSLQLIESSSALPTVLVCPGGGYDILAWDKEGTEIADWLNSLGFSAAILKYRTSQNRVGALQDAQRAMGILRSKAQEWNLDQQQIGILGFSAGAHLSVNLCSNYNSRSYSAVDEADLLSCLPDFALLVYPAYLADEKLQLCEGLAVTSKTPPSFIVHTQDDPIPVTNAIAYYLELQRQNVPSELHIFPHGGHGYGIRPSEHAVSGWHELAKDWLQRRVQKPEPATAST
ncbi:alpha/beta hydrolase [Pelagicoccus mobilis]|uniref:Alpha/beta hydrolase n=1 Tax=Pelagicoccus mobilis TaxID=415221 RepID=A0A934VM61_9BACT|nr:alpha/beta hydrolase [Pelagicoccus mobilis]MBK1878511.1 alpha/beta hydrolase [Pelagicoccus mobilis]